MQAYSAPVPFLLDNNLVLLESMHQPMTASDLYEPCHLHIFISNDISSLTIPLPSGIVPALRVLDLADPQSSDSNIGNTTLIVSTAKNDIRSLTSRLSDRDGIINALLSSIAVSCKTYVRSARAYVSRDAADADDIISTRKEWSRAAHTEIRDVLEPGLDRFERKAVWWKLYFVMDDLETVCEKEVIARFLPSTERSLVYVLGQLSTLSSAEISQKQADKIGTVIANSRDRVATELLLPLHARAQRLVVRTFLDTQLPIAALSFAGWQLDLLEISGYAAGGLAMLGFVWGFKRLQSRWDALVTAFKRDVRDVAREAVDRGEAEIYTAWESKVVEMKKTLEEQASVVEKLEM